MSAHKYTCEGRSSNGRGDQDFEETLFLCDSNER